MLTLLTQRLQDYSISGHSFCSYTKKTVTRGPLRTNSQQLSQNLSVMILERCPSQPKGLHKSAAFSSSSRSLLANHSSQYIFPNANDNERSKESNEQENNAVVSRNVKTSNDCENMELSVDSLQGNSNILTAQDSVESQEKQASIEISRDVFRDINSKLSSLPCNDEMLSTTRVFQHEIPESLSVCDTICNSSVEADRADMILAYSPGLLDSAFVFHDRFTSYFCPSDDLIDDEVRRLLQPTNAEQVEQAEQENDLLESHVQCSEIISLKEGVYDDVERERLRSVSGFKRSSHSLPLEALPVVPRPYLNFDKMQKNTLRRQQSRIRRTRKGGVSKTRLPRFKII